MMISKRFPFALTALLILFGAVKCELFSAIAGLEQMLHVEGNLVQYFTEYLTDLEKKIDYFQR